MALHTRALRHRTTTILVGLVVLTVMLVVLEVPRTADAGRYSMSRAERCMFHKINGMRRRHGLRRLRIDKQLAYAARRHARAMASSNSIWDDPYYGSKVTRWRALAQNSGAGFHCRSLFRSFKRSPAHRRNILGHYRFLGVGSSHAHGRYFDNQLFERRRDPGNIWHYP